VFSKHNKEAFTFRNVEVMPVNNDAFIASMAASTGVLCGAGFEGPAEALYLGKKLLAIPMQDQYEQHCNAAALQDIGVPVIKSLNSKYYDVISDWISSDIRIPVNYPDRTTEIVAQLVKEQAYAGYARNKQQGPVLQN
jgi:uncharacterized protein (TIGR00661 family)